MPVPDHNIPEAFLQQPLQQEPPPQETAHGYVRMAVMDGKTIKHKVSIDICIFS